MRGFTRPQMNYEPPGEGFEHDPKKVADLALTKAIADALQIHYPGHPWLVEVDSAQGVAFLSIPVLMGAQNRYVIHLDALKSDPTMKCVMRGAGEILERYRIHRGKFSDSDFLTALDKVPKWVRGNKGMVPT